MQVHLCSKFEHEGSAVLAKMPRLESSQSCAHASVFCTENVPENLEHLEDLTEWAAVAAWGWPVFRRERAKISFVISL